MYNILLAVVISLLPCSIYGQIYSCIEKSDCIAIATVISDDSVHEANPDAELILQKRHCRIVLDTVCSAWWKSPSRLNPLPGDTIDLKYSWIHAQQKPTVGASYFIPIQVYSKSDYYFSGGEFDLFVADSLSLFNEYATRSGAAKQLPFYQSEKKGRWKVVTKYNPDSTIGNSVKKRRTKHREISWVRNYSSDGKVKDCTRIKYHFYRNGTKIAYMYFRKNGKRTLKRSGGGAFWLD